jgi:hypothetical protein
MSFTDGLMPRKSYLDENLLREISGRLKFGASDIEERLNKIEKPEPKPWSYPTHPLDSTAAEFGLRGFEFKVLQEAAYREMENYPILHHFYKKFLMVAKLVLDDELEKARKHERQVSEEKNAQDRSYQIKLKEWQNRTNQLAKSWTDVRSTIRTRWNRIGKSLAALMEQDARLESMDARDQQLIILLADRGIFKIEDPDTPYAKVLEANWTAFHDLAIEDINEVMLELDRSSAGGFTPKPVVAPLEQVSQEPLYEERS